MTIQFPRMPEQVTRSEAEIIDYISNNPREFLQDSIGAVSQKLGVSGTTLSRFARRVGCEDYKGLKRLVSQQEQPVGPAAKLLETQQGFTVETWMLRQQLCLEKTLEGLDPQAFAQAAQALLDCHRVFIHAKSASASLGQLLLFRLRRLGIEAILLPSGGSEVLEGLSQAHSGGQHDFEVSKAGGVPHPLLYQPQLPARAGAGGHEPVRLPGGGQGVPLYDSARRPNRRAGGGGFGKAGGQGGPAALQPAPAEEGL